MFLKLITMFWEKLASHEHCLELLKNTNSRMSALTSQKLEIGTQVILGLSQISEPQQTTLSVYYQFFR